LHAAGTIGKAKGFVMQRVLLSNKKTVPQIAGQKHENLAQTEWLTTFKNAICGLTERIELGQKFGIWRAYWRCGWQPAIPEQSS